MVSFLALEPRLQSHARGSGADGQPKPGPEGLGVEGVSLRYDLVELEPQKDEDGQHHERRHLVGASIGTEKELSDAHSLPARSRSGLPAAAPAGKASVEAGRAPR